MQPAPCLDDPSQFRTRPAQGHGPSAVYGAGAEEPEAHQNGVEDKAAGKTPGTGAHRRKALLPRESRWITTLTRDFFEKPLKFYMKALTSSSEMDSAMEFSLPVPRLSDLWMSRPVPLASANWQGRASILCCVLPPLHHR